MKTEGQVWELVNRERRSRSGINKNIEMGEWERYFKGLLGGMEGRVIWRERGRESVEGEEDLRRKEVGKVIRKKKDGKATGGGFPVKREDMGGRK